MNKQAINICNTAETAGTVQLLFSPAYLLDASREQQRHDDMNVHYKALTAYRVCREALLDYGISLPDHSMSCIESTSDDLAEMLVSAQTKWREVISQAREQAGALENISDEIDASAAYKLSIAHKLLAQSYAREPMAEPHKVAKTFAALKSSRTSVVESLADAKTKTGNATTAALLRSAEYFMVEHDKSREEVKQEFNEYTKAIKKNLSDDAPETDFGDAIMGFFGAVFGCEDTPTKGRVSTMASYALLATAELSTADLLVVKAQQLLDRIPQPEPIATDAPQDSGAADGLS